MNECATRSRLNTSISSLHDRSYQDLMHKHRTTNTRQKTTRHPNPDPTVCQEQEKEEFGESTPMQEICIRCSLKIKQSLSSCRPVSDRREKWVRGLFQLSEWRRCFLLFFSTQFWILRRFAENAQILQSERRTRTTLRCSINVSWK